MQQQDTDKTYAEQLLQSMALRRESLPNTQQAQDQLSYEESLLSNIANDQHSTSPMTYVQDTTQPPMTYGNIHGTTTPMPTGYERTNNQPIEPAADTQPAGYPDSYMPSSHGSSTANPSSLVQDQSQYISNSEIQMPASQHLGYDQMLHERTSTTDPSSLVQDQQQYIPHPETLPASQTQESITYADSLLPNTADDAQQPSGYDQMLHENNGKTDINNSSVVYEKTLVDYGGQQQEMPANMNVDQYTDYPEQQVGQYLNNHPEQYINEGLGSLQEQIETTQGIVNDFLNHPQQANVAETQELVDDVLGNLQNQVQQTQGQLADYVGGLEKTINETKTQLNSYTDVTSTGNSGSGVANDNVTVYKNIDDVTSYGSSDAVGNADLTQTDDVTYLDTRTADTGKLIQYNKTGLMCNENVTKVLDFS